jgi:hypothetical protein
VPGFGATNDALEPGEICPVLKAPPVAVRVCVVESALCTVTRVPVFTVRPPVNWKFLIVIVPGVLVAPLEGVVDPDEAVVVLAALLLDELHAAAPSAKTTTTSAAARAARILITTTST